MLIAFPSHDLIWAAALSMTNPDAAYPVTNAQNNDTADTAKSSTVSTVVTITVASATPIAFMVANANANSIALSASGMASQAQTIPSRTPDGKQRNGWKSIAGVVGATDTVFDLAMSKPASAVEEFGRIGLVTAWQSVEVLVAGAGQSPTFGHRRPGQVENTTRLGSTPRRASPVAAPRWMTINCFDPASVAILRQLEAECNGLNRGFWLVPNEDLNDVWFAQCAFEDFEVTQELPDDANDVQPVRMRFNEIAMGLPPALT